MLPIDKHPTNHADALPSGAAGRKWARKDAFGVDRQDRSRARVGGRGRQQRYRDLGALKLAVRAECVAYVEREAAPMSRGMPLTWTDGMQRDLDESLDVSEDAHRLCLQLRKALAEAKEFIDGNPGVDDGYASELRRVVRVAVPLVPSLRGEDKLYTRRQLLVAEYDSHGHQWWTQRCPTRKDLAVLSLLAGSFPGHVRTRLKAPPGVTVNEAIQAEERAIDHERDTYGETARRGGCPICQSATRAE